MPERRARGGRVFLGLVAGLIVGAVLGGSTQGVAAAVSGLLTPIGTLWINAVRMTVIPLVVSLLFVSVTNAGQGGALAREAVAAFGAFIGLLVFAAVAACLIAPSLVGQMPASVAVDALRTTAQSSAAATGALVGEVPGFAAWLEGIVPTNVVKAAVDGAMLPLVIFTALFAVAARHIAVDRRAALVEFFSAIGQAMTTVVGWVIWLAPFGVFALVVGPASHNGASFAGAIGYYVVAISLLLILFTMLLYPIAHIAGIPLPVVVRGLLPAQAVALASSSSLASLPALIEGAERIGIPDRVTGFVLPLAVSTFKVATPITWGVGSLFLARLYGITLSPLTVVAMSLAAVAASFGIPGVPQGALLMMAPFLTNFGIPGEGVALLIAADTIPDVFGTLANVTADIVAATIVARVCETAATAEE